MENSQGKKVLILMSVVGLLMLATANLWGVVETSEARYAEISREMFRSGDWLHPTLLNIYHYHKPPVTYWLTAASYSVFGVNTFAVRFPLTIAYCLQIFLIFKLAKHLFKDNQVAYYTALVYSTLPVVLISVRGLTTDAYLTTFILLSLYCWVNLLENRKIRFLYCMAAALGLGFMTKGPVVFIVPLFAVMSLRELYPRPPVNIKQVGIAVLIFIVAGFSWFAFLIQEDFRLADYFFFRHFVDRFAHAEVFARKEPWYYYLPVIPFVTLPWIVFFVVGILGKKMNDGAQRLAKRLLMWWFLLPLIVFSISSSKLVLYILPISIGFSLITGYFLSREIPNRLVLVFSGFPVLVYIGLLLIPLHSPQFTIDTSVMLVPGAALLLSVGCWFLKPARGRIVTISSALFAINLILFASLFFRINSSDVNTLTTVSSFIKQNDLRERNIIAYDELLPSIAFELDKDIISVYDSDRSLKRETQFERNDQWRNFIIDVTDQRGLANLKLLLTKKSVLVLKKELPEKLGTTMWGEWHHKTFGKWIVYYN